MIEIVAEAAITLEVRVTNIEASMASQMVMLNDLKDALAVMNDRVQAGQRCQGKQQASHGDAAISRMRSL